MIVTDDDANRCPACGGNDCDRPCAYPNEGKNGCLRDKRLSKCKCGFRARLVGDVCRYCNLGFLDDE